jgi:YD repeat-containing protein
MSYTNGVLTTTLSYTYDSIGRVRTESKQIGSKTHALSYAYDAFGRLDSVTDANGRKLDYRYDSRGYMNKLYFEGALIWELVELDLSEKTENLGANISVTKSFNVYGQLASIEAAGLFDMSYSFEDSTGNLNWRKQRIFDEGGSCIDTLAEYFSYDSLDRLTQIIGPNDTLSVTFDTGIKERIDSKTDAGADYIYSALNKFQLESIDSATNALAGRPDMHISYTSFNKVDTISEGEYLLTFDYGPNQERVRMMVSRNDTLQYTRYYFGSYEVTEYAGGGYEKDTWLSAGGSAFGFHR